MHRNITVFKHNLKTISKGCGIWCQRFSNLISESNKEDIEIGKTDEIDRIDERNFV